MNYEAPRLYAHGSVEALTLQGNSGNHPSNNIPNGNDPCSIRGPHGAKQTGLADNIHAADTLSSCSV